MLLQTWVGVLLMKQPFFVGGIDNVESAKGSAFGAAGTFFFTFLVSISYMIRQGRRATATTTATDDTPNPFFDRLGGPGSTSLFHDYAPLDARETNEDQFGQLRAGVLS
jgi:hypothetical protein